MLPVLVDEVLLDKPALFVTTINDYFGDGTPFYYIAIITVVVVFLRILHFILGVVITKIFTFISKDVTFEIRVRVLNYLKKVTMGEYESVGGATIGSNLITDVNTIDSFISTGASKFFASVLTLIAISIVMIAIHPILGLMILVIQPVIMFLSKKITKSVTHLKKEENQAIEEFNQNISQTLDLFGQIKASNKEDEFLDESIKIANKVKQTSNEYNYKSVAYERFSFTIFLIVFEILRASGLVMVAYSDLSIGMMFAMFGYIWFIMTPVQDIFSIQYSFASAKGALTRVNKILSLATESGGDIKLDNQNKVTIVCEDMSFKYGSSELILKGINTEFKAGEKIALIGASGSGKTTLAQILSGFYEKESGRLLFNGIDIEKIDKKSLRQEVFLILQMPIMFNDTLRFNITMGEDIDDEKIHEALKIAQLDDVVANMSNGLDTIVGKNGVRLSGGQRQRLSIARMILANPSVVIFDESTSALDVQTEVNLYSALQEILHEKTVITIAHRLSTVKNADKIYVLDNGIIVQEGTHEELESVEGHYTEFLKIQSKQ